MPTKNHGFTLFELLLAIGILGLIALLIVPFLLQTALKTQHFTDDTRWKQEFALARETFQYDLLRSQWESFTQDNEHQYHWEIYTTENNPKTHFYCIYQLYQGRLYRWEQEDLSAPCDITSEYELLSDLEDFRILQEKKEEHQYVTIELHRKGGKIGHQIRFSLDPKLENF